MAENKPAATEPVAPLPAPVKPRDSILTKLLVLVFVGVVIAVECGAAYLLVPSAARTEALAAALREAASAKKEEAEKDKKDKPGDAAGEQSEADLGEFTVTASRPSASSTLRIAFHLYGTVVNSEMTDFTARMKDTQHRFREQVIVILRSAEVGDLTDAGLGLLKRTILEKTNSLLGKPLVKTVIFSDFSFVELQ